MHLDTESGTVLPWNLSCSSGMVCTDRTCRSARVKAYVEITYKGYGKTTEQERLLKMTEDYWKSLGLLGIIEDYWISLGITGDYWGLLRITGKDTHSTGGLDLIPWGLCTLQKLQVAQIM